MKGFYRKGGLFALLASFLMSPAPSCSRRSDGIGYNFLGPGCKLPKDNLDNIYDKKNDFANFNVTTPLGTHWIFVGCKISDARFFGPKSSNFFIYSIFVNSVFKNVTMGPGTHLIAIGGVIKDSQIMGRIRYGDIRSIEIPLFGTEYLEKVTGADTLIQEIFKISGYHPPKMINTIINSGYRSNVALLRNVTFEDSKILKWRHGGIIELPIYGNLGQMPDLREAEFSDFTGAKYINLSKEISNYPQYVSIKTLQALSGGKDLIYCVKKAKVNSKLMFSDEGVQFFIRTFNLLLGRFGIVAIDENEYRASGLKEELYGNITLSKPLKEGYLGSVNRVATLSQNIAIELKYNFLNIITHELAHILGGIHPWKDEVFLATSLSTMMPRPNINDLNSFGPSDIKFLFALMNYTNRAVKKVTEVVNDYFDNGSSSIYLYLPGNQDGKCSNIVYNSKKHYIAASDFGAISRAQVAKLCGYGKEICPEGVQIYKFKDIEAVEFHLLLPIDKCWEVNISDHFGNGKIFNVPIGGNENKQEDQEKNNPFLPLIILISLYAAVNLLYYSKKLLPARRVYNAEAEMFSTREDRGRQGGVNI